MIIQGLNNAASAYGATYKSAVERQTSLAPTANYADKVTLSAEGKTLAAAESAGVITQPRTPAQEHLLRAASSDRESAEKIAYDMTVAPSTIFYSSIYDMGADGKLNKLASSGRIIDTDFRDSFNREASIVDAQRRAIYESEKAKGTDPVQIISMMIDHINSQSTDYLEATGWGWNDGVRMIG